MTALVTGRNPQNGKLLFDVQRDEDNRCEMCMHQDAVGLTPLHAAAMSTSTAALEVVCVLLEANPVSRAVWPAALVTSRGRKSEVWVGRQIFEGWFGGANLARCR